MESMELTYSIKHALFRTNFCFLRPTLSNSYADKCVFTGFLVENAGKLGYTLLKTMDL